MMSQRVPPDQYPWWVRFSLLGGRTRRSQWFWTGLGVAVGLLLILFAVDTLGPARVVYVLAAAWAFVAAGLYGFTIRWMDRHGTWN